MASAVGLLAQGGGVSCGVFPGYKEGVSGTGSKAQQEVESQNP